MLTAERHFVCISFFSLLDILQFVSFDQTQKYAANILLLLWLAAELSYSRIYRQALTPLSVGQRRLLTKVDVKLY